MAAQRQPDEHAHNTTDPTDTGNRKQFRRRGLIAGAAALVAATLAKQAAQPVSAGTDGDVVLGATSPATGSVTTATRITAAVAGAPALVVTNAFTGSVDAIAAGIAGYAAGGGVPGVIGHNNDTNGVGVEGVSPNGTAVFGYNSGAGYGVFATSTAGYGAYCSSSTSTALAGVSYSGDGLYAASTAGNGAFCTTNNATPGSYAVLGQAQQAGYGVGGISGTNHAIVGNAYGSGAAGVVGAANAAGSWGVYGYQGSGVYAGRFDGTTLVNGDFAVTGAKSAALKHPDGSYRLVYCTEAAESWLEDFGMGTLSGGQATITLDADFATFIHTESYHVFLTERDDHNALFVTNQGATGFVVRAKGSTSASGSFSWRVVGKRKDIVGERFAKTVVAEPVPLVPLAAPHLPVPPAGVPKP